MSTNKIDKQIANKLQSRELQPSASAWERLSTQLDEHQAKKKKSWIWYVGYAASIVLLVSLGVLYFTQSNIDEPIEIITDVPVDTLQFDANKFKTIIPEVEEAIVNSEKQEETIIKKESTSVVANNTITTKKLKKDAFRKELPIPKEKTIIAKVDTKNIEVVPVDTTKKVSPKKKTRITVNSDDLLYAVTHTPEEVKAYYAKYNVNRDDVLKTIQLELKKSKLKINPNTILAEVERDIDDDLFKNNFMQNLKSKISSIAVAIADRNK